jgi:hypothetical protein
MIGEISLYGIYIPWLLLLSLFALAASRVLSRLLGRLGFYRLVWHPALFDFALFIIVLGGASFVSSNLFY